MEVAIVLVIAASFAAAAPTDTRDATPVEALAFLKTFGYLESREGEGEVIESLYKENVISEAIQEAQKFGGLPMTGRLDNKTLQLMQSKRCGVEDVLRGHPPGFSPRYRQKRYVVATKGWNRRHLTYFLVNTSPRMDYTDAKRELRKALEIWGKYARLDFSESRSPYDADILVSFYRGNHGDSYPFDGVGSILAHAFFPNGASLGGDVHFDDDEDWKISMGQDRQGVHFGAVALHELGHSLGLAHSPAQGSVMNPYYKGDGMDLGYDDILAMHELYISRRLEDEDNWDSSRRTSTERWRTSRIFTTTRPTTRETTSREPRTPERRVTTRRYEPSTTESWRRETERWTTGRTPRSTTPWWEGEGTRSYQGDDESVETHKGHDDKHRVPPTQGPDNTSACLGHFTTVANVRRELFIVKGQMLWRLSDPGKVAPGYPVKLHRFFHKLPESVQYIDAIHQRDIDSNIIFFSGKRYWVFNGYDFIENSPRNISDYGLPSDMKKIDTVMNWGKDSKTYIFSGGEYWRYDERSRSPDPGYPRHISDFKGVPWDLDAALTWKDGVTYFFKDDDYWVLDNDKVAVKEGYPRSASQDWLSC